MPTSQTQVTVKSISGLRAEQVTSRFSREIESGINDRVIIHVGTNNVQSDSIEEITNKFISLANNLSQTYKNVTFSSIIRRKDKPYLNDKIDVVNKKLYDICVSAGVEYIDNTNIVFSNLSRDGLHLNRSGQGKVTANICNTLS